MNDDESKNGDENVFNGKSTLENVKDSETKQDYYRVIVPHKARGNVTGLSDTIKMLFNKEIDEKNIQDDGNE